MWRFWLYSILFQIIYPCFKLRISSAFAVCWCQLIVSIGQLRITNDYRASEIDWVDPFELSRHRNIFGAVQHLLFLTNPKSLYTFFVNCSTALGQEVAYYILCTNSISLFSHINASVTQDMVRSNEQKFITMTEINCRCNIVLPPSRVFPWRKCITECRQ